MLLFGFGLLDFGFGAGADVDRHLNGSADLAVVAR